MIDPPIAEKIIYSMYLIKKNKEKVSSFIILIKTRIIINIVDNIAPVKKPFSWNISPLIIPRRKNSNIPIPKLVYLISLSSKLILLK